MRKFVLICVLEDRSVTSMKWKMFQNATELNKHEQQWKISAQLINACMYTHKQTNKGREREKRDRWRGREKEGDQVFPKVSHKTMLSCTGCC